ncbi:hypothetical protein [Flagellimonas crocea]|uniref:hypothetical protein n=1 Tax=Flagellimonas crocea TaxID=3067311 RepID=UPI00296F378D|nr:hypothetical protein [Muricauda sp. DH64]
MNQQDETFEEILSDYNYNIRRWKSLVKHMENEVVFLDRLLSSEAFGTVMTHTMRERHHHFKKMVKVKAEILADFKAEVDRHQADLLRLAPTKHVGKNAMHTAQHESLKIRFEKFCKEFDEFRTRVLLQTGSAM